MRAFRLTGSVIVIALATALVTAVAVGVPFLQTAVAAGETMTTPSGLQITDSVEGTGATPRTGQTCVMHYTGWLYKDGEKGAKFDSSVDRGSPFEFTIGVGQVIEISITVRRTDGPSPGSYYSVFSGFL